MLSFVFLDNTSMLIILCWHAPDALIVQWKRRGQHRGIPRYDLFGSKTVAIHNNGSLQVHRHGLIGTKGDDVENKCVFGGVEPEVLLVVLGYFHRVGVDDVGGWHHQEGLFAVSSTFHPEEWIQVW